MSDFDPFEFMDFSPPPTPGPVDHGLKNAYKTPKQIGNKAGGKKTSYGSPLTKVNLLQPNHPTGPSSSSSSSSSLLYAPSGCPIRRTTRAPESPPPAWPSTSSTPSIAQLQARVDSLKRSLSNEKTFASIWRNLYVQKKEEQARGTEALAARERALEVAELRVAVERRWYATKKLENGREQLAGEQEMGDVGGEDAVEEEEEEDEDDVPRAQQVDEGDAPPPYVAFVE